jgi:Tol biopolymer transport system component
MSVNGSGVVRLTNNTADDLHPVWSPDGSRIAFASDRDGNFNIYTMSADGSDLVRLTDDSVDYVFPTWSSDGSQIACVSSQEGNADIYLMKADGSNLTRLTHTASVDEWAPDWSPDGTLIAFSADQGSDEHICVVDIDSEDRTCLTSDQAWDAYPAWSPDGKRIAFQTTRDGSHWELAVMNADGSDLRRLSTTGGEVGLYSKKRSNMHPIWSPDGSRVFFTRQVTSEESKHSFIMMMYADHSGTTYLTKDGRDVGPISLLWPND